MMDITQLSLNGTPFISGQSLSPDPVLESLLDKMKDSSLEGFLNAAEGVDAAMDLREFASGLAAGDIGEAGKGLLGLSGEIQSLIEMQSDSSSELSDDLMQAHPTASPEA